MKPFFETERLIVKAPSLDNFANIFSLLSNPQVMQYVGRGVKTKKEAGQFLEKMHHHFEKHGFALGDVYEKASNQFIGNAGLIYLEMNDAKSEIELGYRLHPAYWHQGYATELASALIDWGFTNLTVTKLVAVIHPQNEASRKVLEKVGMHYLGMVSCYGTEVAKYEIIKNTLDKTKITLTPAPFSKYPIIQNMGRFYAYDMSEYFADQKAWKIPSDGLYECIDFKHYWDNNNAFPFLVHYDNELAGFVIVTKKGSEPNIDFVIAQFFIFRKFKRKGLGRFVAQHSFDKFSGTWEVMVLPGNEGAYRFWRRIINDYTKGQFLEYTKKIPHFKNATYNIFKFNSIK